MTEQKWKKGQKEMAQTISNDLLNEFRRLRRNGDSEEIAKHLGVSAPTISNVYVYGYVKNQKIQEYMVAFYEERAKAEIQQVERLKKIKDSL